MCASAMRRFRVSLVLVAPVAALLLASNVSAAEPAATNPLIKDHGGIAPLPTATMQPRSGSAVVFDITGGSPAPGKPAKGLDRMARLLNLYAAGGVKPTEARFAIVLHGDATLAALHGEAYAEHHQGAENPHLDLIRTLHKHGVQVYVCGQSLAKHGCSEKDVDASVSVALSAMNALINLQNDGHAYLPFF